MMVVVLDGRGSGGAEAPSLEKKERRRGGRLSRSNSEREPPRQGAAKGNNVKEEPSAAGDAPHDDDHGSGIPSGSAGAVARRD
jgi:hypothetical protein